MQTTNPFVSLFLASSLFFCVAPLFAETHDAPLKLGDRRELFIDDYLVESLDGVERLTHRPERKNLVAIFDKPWEGESEGYCTVLFDGTKDRMFYRAWGIEQKIPMSIACLESDDGVNWTRPEYGLCEYEGSKKNNILLQEFVPGSGLGTHDFTPFLDERPGVPADEKYKTVCHGEYANAENHGLYAFKSSDAIHWSLMQETPVYTDGRFDTQNVAFWSTTEQKYVLYYREFRRNTRVVFRAVSDDFLHWKNEGEIRFPEGQEPTPREQLYTNQIQPYYRAPHIYVGFPARYVDNGLTVSTSLLPEWEERQARMKLPEGGERLGTAVTDSVLITSRDGLNFTKANDVFIAPGLRTKHNWFYGDNYLAWNMVETKSLDDDSPNEISIYSLESSATNNDARLRRYALRIDGFVSIHAKSQEGVATTKPLTFDGAELSLNVATSAAGFVRVEVLDEEGNVLPDFSADDCDLIYGDSLDRRVSWKGSRDMSNLAGKTIKLRFLMKEADLYSLKWER